MNRPNCKKCQAQLIGPVEDSITVCPDCGKRWRLTDDNSAIYSVSLDVHSSTIGMTTEFNRS
jgi:hypothetical protein